MLILPILLALCYVPLFLRGAETAVQKKSDAESTLQFQKKIIREVLQPNIAERLRETGLVDALRKRWNFNEFKKKDDDTILTILQEDQLLRKFNVTKPELAYLLNGGDTWVKNWAQKSQHSAEVARLRCALLDEQTKMRTLLNMAGGLKLECSSSDLARGKIPIKTNSSILWDIIKELKAELALLPADGAVDTEEQNMCRVAATYHYVTTGCLRARDFASGPGGKKIVKKHQKAALEKKIAKLTKKFSKMDPNIWLSEEKCFAVVTDFFKDTTLECFLRLEDLEVIEYVLQKLHRVSVFSHLDVTNVELAFWLGATAWIKKWAQRPELKGEVTDVRSALLHEKEKMISVNSSRKIDEADEVRFSRILKMLDYELALLGEQSGAAPQDTNSLPARQKRACKTPACIASRNFAITAESPLLNYSQKK